MFSWDTYNEDISSLDDSLAFSSVGLLEQINVTRDASDIFFLLLSFCFTKSN
ncbi:Beta-galactosidase 3 [Camellia lanceoleosa]|uniref:Beta-galactosidase 3 n=1 Tax=Camellia lanceoleosa TaxID=1840588 RepID=A0ACC0FW47_9ERIC|nr:Beta-galactosidase 3 [Camellia lanceoleosa]